MGQDGPSYSYFMQPTVTIKIKWKYSDKISDIPEIPKMLVGDPKDFCKKISRIPVRF